MGAGSRATPTECVEAYAYVHRPFRVLLLRRPPPRGGFWVPVSGKVEPTDPDHRSAALRELREETGLSRVRSADPLDWVVGFVGPDGRPWRLEAFAVELDTPAGPTLSEEHDAFEWSDPADAAERLHFEDNRGAVRRLIEWRRLGRLPRGPNV